MVEPRVFEPDTTPGDAVRRFEVCADRHAGIHDVLNAEKLPKFGEKHKEYGLIVADVLAVPVPTHPLQEYSYWSVTVTYRKAERRKVCCILVDRANYGRLVSVLRAIRERNDLELQIICAGSMLLRRFDLAVEAVEKEFGVDGKVYCEIEGSTLGTMADSIGYAIPLFGAQLERLKPNIVLAIGDRYEMLAAVIAAAYRNTTIVHLQGGEVSGSIDESARHCLTKLAHYHVPATEQAALNIRLLGERPESIIARGCPSADLAAEVDYDDEPDEPILCVYHPTTTEYGTEAEQMKAVLDAVSQVPCAVELLWSNIDAGGDAINKAIRSWMDRYRERGNDLSWLTTIKNLPPEKYLERLANTKCAVGNSSSFCRDAGFFGSPVVLVGNRQSGRECGPNVLRVKCGKEFIRSAIEQQLEHGRYPASDLYGEPGVSEEIAEKLATVELYSQKRLYYPPDRE